MQTEKSDISGFAFAVTGWIDIRLREKMEMHYENVKEQTIKQYQPEALIPSAYKSEFGFKDREDMYKEIYYNIDFFEQIIHEALQNLRKGSTKNTI